MLVWSDMAKAKLTKSWVNNLSHPIKGHDYYYDVSLKGFGLRVGKESKVYFAESRVDHRTTRVKIGPHDQVACEEARKRAQKLLGQMADGVNPNLQKKSERHKGITLSVAFEEFLEARTLKPRTIKDYQRAMDVAFKDWKYKRIIDVKKDMVSKRYKQLGKKLGQAQANQAMRFLRSLLYFCIGNYEDAAGDPLLKYNPVRRLSDTKTWVKVPRRQTIIENYEVPVWFKAVMGLRSEICRDYILLILFTGLRKQEGLRLKKNQIDLKAKTFTVLDTKNDKDLYLPIPKYLFGILKDRINKNKDSEYLFPGNGKTGHLAEPKKSIQKVVDVSGVQFCLHDLRRFFITTAESLEISIYNIKQLVNHSLVNDDVTAGYIVNNVKRLRLPMQKIEDRILFLAGMKSTGKIVQLSGG
jgi:integrase